MKQDLGYQRRHSIYCASHWNFSPADLYTRLQLLRARAWRIHY